jgi:choline dehydrogenase-like flavoprotein
MNSAPLPSATFDALIVGSGAGGCAAAYKLVTAGLRVALIEKGNALPRDSSTLDFDKVVHQGLFKSQEQWSDRVGTRFAPEEHFNLGGKTKWYGAALLRYGRHEFAPDPAHQCLGWPFDYNEFESYYEEAEKLLGVRVFDVEPDLVRIVSRLNAKTWRSIPLPLSLEAGIVRNKLEASRFDGFASVANLKGDGETAFLSRLRGRPNFTLVTGEAVVDLIGDPASPRRIIGVRLKDGRAFHGRSVLMAAGALHSPRLLQRYIDTAGIADEIQSADAIGRYLKLHLLTAVVAISASLKTDLLRKTAILINDSLPHSSIQPLGFDGELIGTLIPPLLPRWAAKIIGSCAYGFFLQTEDSAHRDNRVYDKDYRGGTLPVLDYDAARSVAALREHTRLIGQFRRALAGAGMLAFSQRIGIAGTAHASGTLVAGTDPASSVVGADGRVHGLDSLYVVDGSVLPRSSRVNPSLTIYAWSLRVSHLLAASLQRVTSSAPAVVS